VPPTSRKVPQSAIRRLSLYLRVLEELEAEGELTASSRILASRTGTTAAQVRKDLSFFGSFGKRGLGYAVGPLTGQLREILGLSKIWRMALVGAGRMGAALFEYPHFRERGFEFVAVFDSDPAKIGRRWNGLTVRSPDHLTESLREAGVEIAVLTVPARSAQDVTDAVVAAGVRGILNFAPAQIRVPAGVTVNDVNMTVELEALSFSLHPGSGTDRPLPE
jgi:redox-sensing transcriptional repressor